MTRRCLHHTGEIAHGSRGGSGIAYILPYAETLLEKLSRSSEFAMVASIDSQGVQCDRDAALIVEFGTGFQAFFEKSPRRIELTLGPRQDCGSE